MSRLGALEALGRGLANLRGNLELVAVNAAGTLLLFALFALSLLPWLGSEPLAMLWNGDVAGLGELFSRSGGLLDHLLGLLASLTLATAVATVVYAWYWGGSLAVLVAGDAQAPAGGGRPAVLYRTWSPRFFAGEANRLTLRFVLFLSLWSAGLFAAALLLLLAIVLGGAVGAGSGFAAGAAVGCGAALPVLFVVFVLVAAMTLAQVEAVPPAAGVLAASRAGLALLGRRLGATVALLVLMVCASVAIGLFDVAAGAAVESLLGETPLASGAIQALLFGVQLFAGAFVNLALAAAAVALVRGEHRLAAAAAR